VTFSSGSLQQRFLRLEVSASSHANSRISLQQFIQPAGAASTKTRSAIRLKLFSQASMKSSFLVVLVCGALVGVLALNPTPVKAMTDQTAQLPPLPPPPPRLNLSADQETQLRQIHQNAEAQIDRILTAEQQQQLKAALNQDQPFPEAIGTLTLSDTQQTQLQSIFHSVWEQSEAVLTPEQRQQMQAFRATHRPGEPGQLPPELEGLNLTADQKTQLAQIHQSTQTQLESIFSPEQQQQLKAAQEQGQPFPEAIESLNPSAEQKSQLQSIFRTSRQQIEAVFTSEQRQQLQELRRTHQGQLPPL
jgi:protein CpxP